MKAIIKLSSRITLEIEETDDLETLHKAISLITFRETCNICGKKEGFKLTAKRAKGYIFINLACPCGAESGLGQLKDKGGHWWKEFEKYVPEDKQ